MIERYSFEDADGTEQGFTTFDYEEAKAYARKYRLRVIANEYEWCDSSLVDDFTAKKPRRVRS